MRSNRFVARRRSYPFATLASMNRSRCFAISAGFFFPIALRRLSASPIEYEASRTAICITCSW